MPITCPNSQGFSLAAKLPEKIENLVEVPGVLETKRLDTSPRSVMLSTFTERKSRIPLTFYPYGY
jgi:hypothetical protein